MLNFDTSLLIYNSNIYLYHKNNKMLATLLPCKTC